jgi:hypothetical protein
VTKTVTYRSRKLFCNTIKLVQIYLCNKNVYNTTVQEEIYHYAIPEFHGKNLNYTMCNSDFSTKEWKYRISNKLILFRTINGYYSI